jgi:hypothetical protein
MSWVITGSQKEPAGDPFFFSNVSLLLHGDGPNGSTLIRDSSSRMNTVTAVGNAKISTAQSKFGGASIAFDGTGDYLTLSSNAAFNYLAESFTIEGWLNSNNAALLQTIFTQASFDGAKVNGLVLRVNLSKLAFAYYNNLPGPLFTIGDTTTLSINTWYHFAVSREGNVFRLFLNGTLEGTTTNTISTAQNKTPHIGRWEGFANRDFNGYIDDFRITKGIARYTANFTPPTAPFPDI